MPVRVYLLKQIANAGGQDTGLQPEDANKRLLSSHHFYTKQ